MANHVAFNGYNISLKGINKVGNLMKIQSEDVEPLLKHHGRAHHNYSNQQINLKKSGLNYTVGPYSDNIKKAKEIYQKLTDNSYLYGRETKREKKAITCCSWVFTLPKEVSDYSFLEKDELIRINPNSEKDFFQGIYDFISARYGTVFYDRVHYDEGGQPHIHIYFVPSTNLDHDLVHFKTQKTSNVKRTESGRYEFIHRIKKDANGNPIVLKNYSKISDYYDTKISAADVCNKAELQHIHQDLAKYMKENNIPGAEYIYTGKTGSTNFSVKTLKDITKVTGLTIDEIKELAVEKNISLEKNAEFEQLIKELSNVIDSKDKEIASLNEELTKANEKIKELEHTHEVEHTWGNSTWGNSNSWGQKNNTIEEEKIW